jgi:hypothetical protein
MRKALAAGALSASLLAGGTVGALLFAPSISGAQTATTEAPATAPSEPGTPPAWMTDTLSELVANGTLTQAQADAVSQALEAAKPAHGPGGRGGPGHGRGGMGLDAAATALGMTADELRTELQSGQTIAQVAEAKGVATQTVIDAIVAEMNAHFDEELAAGEHTQEEIDQRKADAVERATDMVNGTMPAKGEGRGGPGGRGPRGHQAPDDQSTTPSTEAPA